MYCSNWPAEREQLPGILTQVKSEVLEGGLNEGAADRLELALEELLVNIMDHSLKGEGGFWLVLNRTDDGFVLETRDEGVPWEGSIATPDLEASLEERDIGGLGLFMMEQLVERVAYERRDGFNFWQLFVK